MIDFNNDWNNILRAEFEKEYYKALRSFLVQEYKEYTIYPNMYDIFNALKLTSYSDTKVVIIGQDPYHEPNQAHGLAFSVLKGNKLPPSLKNIFKEIEDDLHIKMPTDFGDLTKWAKQGILLLNNVLTVRAHLANSHRKKGWEIFTDEIVKYLNKREDPIIFVFWGNNAKEKKALVTNKNHIILTAPHPSPLSAYQGFFGCKHFSKINDILQKNSKKPIDWQL